MNGTVARMSIAILPGQRFPLGISVLILASVAALLILLPARDLPFVLAAIGGCAVVCLMIWKPSAWVIVFVLSLPYWLLTETDPELRFDEILVAAFYLLSVLVWFGKALVARQRIVHNEIDAGILLFFALGTLPNFFIALLNDVEPLRWIRTWSLLATMLLYFPLRDFLRTSRQRHWFLVGLLILALIAAAKTAYQYWLATQNIVYAYEVIASRVVINAFLFLGASVLTLIAALLLDRWSAKIPLFLAQTISTIALIVSFFRGFWIAFFFTALLLFWYLPKQRKWQLIALSSLAAIIAIAIFALFFKSYMDIALQMLEYRFASIGSGTQDISLQARLSETAVVLDLIGQNPLGGYGLGSTFTYYSPIHRYHQHTPYIHNTYLYLSFTFGIPLALVFVLTLLTAIRRGIQWSKRPISTETRIYLLGASLLLFGLMITALTFCILYQRDSLLMIATALLLLSWGLEQAGYRWTLRKPD